MIALFGASGYIGSAFRQEMDRRGILYTAVRRDEPCAILRPSMIELVINCAAYIPPRSVDDCEDNKSKTVEGNLLFPSGIATQCAMEGIPFMQISTGCLYNGHGPEGKGFTETEPSHLNFDTGAGIYVSTKEMAERVVMSYDKSYSLRIRLPFDEEDHPRNLLSKLMRFDKLHAATNSLTHRKDFVCAALDLWERRAPFGCYNMTNPGSIMVHDICAMMNVSHGPREWQFFGDGEYEKLRRTPASVCTLDVSKLLATGVRMRHVRDAVEWSLKNWRPSTHVSEPHQMSRMPEPGSASAP